MTNQGAAHRHSLGPWHITPCGCCVEAADGVKVATQVRRRDIGLISAAPGLLKACEYALERAAPNTPEQTGLSEIIRKAKGDGQ